LFPGRSIRRLGVSLFGALLAGVSACAPSEPPAALARAITAAYPANPCLVNVEYSFDRIPDKVRSSSLFGSTSKYLGARNTLIPWPRYTSQSENNFGLEEHFQGIQRLGAWDHTTGRHFVLSGGIKNGTPQKSQLIVFEMGTQPATGPWALPDYGYDYENPPAADRTVAVVDIDTTYWHAGGIQALNNLVAVPLYGDGTGSEVRYFDLQVPTAPVELSGIRLSRPHTTSNAAALTVLPNGYYMTLVWDDQNLEFHLSNSTDVLAGFQGGFQRVAPAEVVGGFAGGGCGSSGCGTYQSINFVNQCDGTVYLVAARNTQLASPTVTGTDYASLYRVTWPGGDYGAKPTVTWVKRRQFYCYNQQCNFGAAAGVYANDGDHLYLYGASHWLHNGNARYNYNEYSY
jgi:hypothetical protein